MAIPDKPKTREKVIPIRYPTPSRTPIVIVVAQRQDAQGRWMVPTIIFEGNLQQHLESGRFALDLGIAFIVAAYWYDQFMLAMKRDYLGEEENER
jgi:hypothetical protein